ncbi:MAG TPA: hypothetical protein VGN07_23795 [Steroidobacteraceae bacterium]|jgi:hypothetical protein
MAVPQQVLERFLKSDAGTRIVAELNIEHLERRRALVREISEERRRFADSSTWLDHAVALAEKRHETATAALAEAVAELQAAATRKLAAIFDCDNAIARHERELLALADARIDDFLRELSNLQSATMAQYVSTERTDYSFVIPRREGMSNAHVIEPKLQRIRLAREKAEALKLAATDDIPRELDSLRQFVENG